jgi:hypothetical protein
MRGAPPSTPRSRAIDVDSVGGSDSHQSYEVERSGLETLPGSPTAGLRERPQDRVDASLAALLRAQPSEQIRVIRCDNSIILTTVYTFV